MSILRQAYCSPKYLYFLLPGVEKPVRDPDGTRRRDILVSSPDEFVTLWNQSVEALERSIKLLTRCLPSPAGIGDWCRATHHADSATSPNAAALLTTSLSDAGGLRHPGNIGLAVAIASSH